MQANCSQFKDRFFFSFEEKNASSEASCLQMYILLMRLSASTKA
jgi:hypothetical protein